MQLLVLSLVALPALALASCTSGDGYYCLLTSKGWKPAAASYLVADGVSDTDYIPFSQALSTAHLSVPTSLDAVATAAAAAFTAKGGDVPELYTLLNAEISQLPENARQPAQSVISKALALQNGAPAAKPTDMAFMAVAGAAAAGVAGLAL